MRIDFHTHVVADDLPDFAERYGDRRWPVFVNDGRTGRLIRDGRTVRTVSGDCWSPERRLEHMDSTGVDLQVLSPLPPLIGYWAAPAPAAEFSRRVNESIARMVDGWPARFAGLGTVPLQHTDSAIAVLEEARALGLSGVQIGTRIGDTELDAPRLRPFFAAAAELKMTVFVHPLVLGPTSDWTRRIDGMPVNFGLGMTTDTALAAAALVLGGVKQDVPDLRICLAHGGGTFVWSLPRIARLWPSENPPLTDLLRGVFVDTVVYDGRNLDYLAQLLGHDRLLFGTDYPLPAADTRAEYLEDLPAAAISAVCGDNALPLLAPVRSLS